jgi:hypothetical protein
MKITVSLALEVEPGTETNETEITRNASTQLADYAMGLGFAYGPVAYEVLGVSVL